MNLFLSFIVMVTMSPIVAVTTLVCYDPERWGGSLNPLAILVMSFFGLITTPLWPTYIPALVVTPFLMHRVASSRWFKTQSLSFIVFISFLLGIIAGIGVISIIVPWRESLDLILNWLAAGAVSGGITLPIISLLFRCAPEIA
jgi:hypothetical protein